MGLIGVRWVILWHMRSGLLSKWQWNEGYFVHRLPKQYALLFLWLHHNSRCVHRSWWWPVYFVSYFEIYISQPISLRLIWSLTTWVHPPSEIIIAILCNVHHSVCRQWCSLDTFIYSLTKKFYTHIKSSFICRLTDWNKRSLVQVMAWCRSGDDLLAERVKTKIGDVTWTL